jgi:hypothetical protein
MQEKPKMDASSKGNDDLARQEQRYDRYFCHARPWKNLPIEISRLLATRFAKLESSIFQLFLEEASANKLVKRHFIPIAEQRYDAELCVNQFAHTLYNYASKYCGLVMEKQKNAKYVKMLSPHVKALFQCTLALEPSFFAAKFGLAVLFRTLLDFDKSMHYCREALADIAAIESKASEKLSIFEKSAMGLGMTEIKEQITKYMVEIDNMQNVVNINQ